MDGSKLIFKTAMNIEIQLIDSITDVETRLIGRRDMVDVETRLIASLRPPCLYVRCLSISVYSTPTTHPFPPSTQTAFSRPSNF